jgi:hypothetical protein
MWLTVPTHSILCVDAVVMLWQLVVMGDEAFRLSRFWSSFYSEKKIIFGSFRICGAGWGACQPPRLSTWNSDHTPSAAGLQTPPRCGTT